MRTPAAVASVLVIGAAALGGCGAPSAGPARAPAATSSPTPSAPDPVEACVRQVTYWVGESLRTAPDQGFDYQHMGLSGATYELVRTVTAEARGAGGDTERLVETRALEECRVLKGSDPALTGSNGTGWP